MSMYLQAAVVILLLIGAGSLFIIQTSWNRKSDRVLRGTGYGLISMAFFLIGFGVLQHFDMEAHRLGH